MIELHGQIAPVRLHGQLNKVPSESSGGPLQSKTAWPSHSQQIITPDDDYYGLASVKVEPVPRLPACVASFTEAIHETVENVVNISAVASVECEDILLLHSVESVSGASYGFSKNSNGYYESKNKGKNSSYAICKVALWAREETTVTLNCINYAESSYDYGLISEIDTMLEQSASADSSGVFKSFKGQSSQDVVQVVISVPAGDHYFCVKFIKDSSGANGNDTFQFAIAE